MASIAYSLSLSLSCLLSSLSLSFSLSSRRRDLLSGDMKNSVSDRSFYAESGSDADEGVDEEQQDKLREAEDDESDGSDSSSVSSPPRSRPNSYNKNWPQSYRQSIDIYSSVTPPTIGFLGTPTLSKLGSRLGSSFLLSSFRGQQTPESNSSFIKPLLPSKVDSRDEQQQRRSSQSLLAPPVPAHRSSVRKPRTDYKPVRAVSHELPATPRQCSFSQGVINGVNVLCGVGILAAPYAIKEGGWIGLSVLLLYAILTFYTAILLRLCLDSEPGLETYPDIGQAAFGRIGRIVVSIILYLELYSCCVEYIILESDNWSSFFPNAHLDIGGLHLDSHVLFAVMATTIVLPTTWLRDLSILSYVSAGGVIATILVVGCLFWVGLIDQIGFKNEGSFVNLSGFTIAIGLYGYAYSGHAVYPNIYSSLKKQKDYTAVLFTSFCISTLLFAAAAAMGFVLFGLSTQSQFTLNMPHKFVASNVAGWTTVVNPITKYSLTLNPMALSLEELIPPRYLTRGCSIALRTALTISSLVVALSVPFFGLLMSLIGSFLTMLVALILPCLCYLRIARSKATRTEVSMCTVILIVGVVSSAFGTFSAISTIISSLN